jgi:HAD superfamily hydrolase (TIGR01509 family)
MLPGAPTSFALPQQTYAAYIFDCDGTLADTMPLHHRAWERALRDHGAAFRFSWELFVSRAGMTLEQTVVELARQFDVALDPQAIALAQRRHFELLEPEMQPVADVVHFARSVARTHPVSVASGSLRATVDRTLARLGLLDLFPVVVTPEDVERGKPEPDMFLRAAELMGVSPQRCLVFEDGEMGIEAARRAGMDVVRVTTPLPADRLPELA